jgi:chromosome segregation ATPase
VLNDKVSELWRAYIAEADPATQLNLKKQIEEAEVNRKQIEQRLEALDQEEAQHQERQVIQEQLGKLKRKLNDTLPGSPEEQELLEQIRALETKI